MWCYAGPDIHDHILRADRGASIGRRLGQGAGAAMAYNVYATSGISTSSFVPGSASGHVGRTLRVKGDVCIERL